MTLSPRAAAAADGATTPTVAPPPPACGTGAAATVDGGGTRGPAEAGSDAACEDAAAAATTKRTRLPLFERFLSVWVLACMVAGAALGAKVPRLAAALAGVQVGGVNMLVSILVWAMIFPMLLAVDLAALRAAAATPALFLVAPLAAAAAVRWGVLRWRGPAALAALRQRLAPAVGGGLLATLALVFLFQGEAIVARPAHIAMIAAPLALQTFGAWAFAYAIGGGLCALGHAFLAPASLIATSNFFGLAVATAAAVYGPASGAALATTVGVLVEVPLMLALVAACNALRPSVERRRAARLAGGGWSAWVARLCGGRGARGGDGVGDGDGDDDGDALGVGGAEAGDPPAVISRAGRAPGGAHAARREEAV